MTAHHDAVSVIAGVRAVTPFDVLDDATIVVEDGLVVEVRSGGPRLGGAIDGHNLIVLPGLVDSHSDGLEKEVRPRRTSVVPAGFALGAFEARIRAAGVTTVFHGIGYQTKHEVGRSIEGARALAECIHDRRAAAATVDHRILYRFEARDPDAVGPLIDDLQSRPMGDGAPLVSFEDHTPGQGQYRDVAQYTAALDPAHSAPGETVDERVARVMAEAAELVEWRERNLRRLALLAAAGAIRLMAHDPETADDIERAAEAGASIAEFPVTLEAAKCARERGMAVVMGAPNALRGESHSGNVSARRLVAAGLCDVLASDYLPAALVATVFDLAARSLCSLSEAVGLITSGPATMAGLADRGRLEKGAVADLVFVDDRGPWPSVVGVRRATDGPDRRVLGL